MHPQLTLTPFYNLPRFIELSKLRIKKEREKNGLSGVLHELGTLIANVRLDVRPQKINDFILIVLPCFSVISKLKKNKEC